MVLVYIIYLFFRNPEILIEGRFFAEEGSVFWSYALANSALETLFFVPVTGGYMLFNANIQILLSTYFPLIFSPLVTVWTSIIISLLPSFLYFKLNSKAEENIFHLSVSIALIYLPSLNFLEVFANSINSQTYLGIASLIIVIYGLKNNDSTLYKTQLFILFVSFLSGYYSLILTPILLIKYLFEKNKKLKIPFLFSLISGIINLNILYFTFTNNILFEGKLDSSPGLQYLIEIINKSLLVNLLSEKFFNNLIVGNYLLVAFFITTVYVFFASNIKNKKEIYYFYTALFLEVILVYFGQAGQTYDQRYAVVISTVLFLILISILKNYSLGHYFVIIFIFIGFINFNFQRADYFIDCKEFCLPWSEQIRNLESEPRIIHWPMGEGSPYWYTDFDDPKPTPAPFQIELIGENYESFYEVTLFDILKSNLNS